MTGVRVFLGLSVLVWLPYGLYLAASPDALAGIAGVAATTATGTTELRAMYGGAQTAIGAIALLGLVRAAHARAALVTLGCLTAGLGSVRLAGAVVDGSFGAYTNGALVLELGSVALVAALLRRGSTAGA